MRSVIGKVLCVCACAVALMTNGGAQTPAASSQSETDPRVGLKGGLTDAAVAAKGLDLLSTLPKREGFIDP